MTHKSEKQMQGEMDASTLAEADVISGTPGRLAGAKRAAVVLAVEQQKRADGLKRVATRQKKTGTSAKKARRQR